MPQAKLELAVSFVRAHPDEAADTLEQYPPSSVAEFIQRTPHTLAAGVFERLLPHYAARLLKCLPDNGAALLSAAGTRTAVAALRYLAPEDRASILHRLPAAKAADCRLLLNYTLDTVGAWMLPRIAMLTESTPVNEALTQLSGETATLDSDAVYVVDRRSRLRGIVGMPVLLRAGQQQTPPAEIRDVMQRHPETVASRATLSSIQHHEGWDQSDTLPVINRELTLVGMLRHVDMRKGLDYLRGHGEGEPSGHHPIADLYHTYSRVLFALCDVAGGLAGPGRPK